jgi:type VI secretion system protein ImpH
MVPTRRRKATDLTDRLRHEPYRFDFFQLVRLLERLARENRRQSSQPVGSDGNPEQECVRFRALPSLTHPQAPVAQLRWPVNEAKAVPEMLVSFLGLTGPTGALPPHYTALLLRRLRAKDTALRDLFDLFHHRLVSLFYRAWEKYRLPFAFERSQQAGAREPGKIVQSLYCLAGRGTAGLRDRSTIPEPVFLYYAGHFAHHPRSAAALELMLTDYFKLPFRVRQFQVQHLRLGLDDRTQFPRRPKPRGRNTSLGIDTVLGERVVDAQGKFRLRIGPLTYAEFRRFFPIGGDLLRPVLQFTHSYIGAEFTFDLQPVLKPAEVPRLRLGAKGVAAPHLGWNTWVTSRPVQREADDAVFAAVEKCF